MTTDCPVKPIVDPSGSAIEKTGAIAVWEVHVAVEVGEYLAFEPGLRIVALVSPILAGVALSHFCPTERVWATLYLVSFWALGMMF